MWISLDHFFGQARETYVSLLDSGSVSADPLAEEVESILSELGVPWELLAHVELTAWTIFSDYGPILGALFAERLVLWMSLDDLCGGAQEDAHLRRLLKVPFRSASYYISESDETGAETLEAQWSFDVVELGISELEEGLMHITACAARVLEPRFAGTARIPESEWIGPPSSAVSPKSPVEDQTQATVTTRRRVVDY